MVFFSSYLFLTMFSITFSLRLDKKCDKALECLVLKLVETKLALNNKQFFLLISAGNSEQSNIKEQILLAYTNQKRGKTFSHFLNLHKLCPLSHSLQYSTFVIHE